VRPTIPLPRRQADFPPLNRIRADLSRLQGGLCRSSIARRLYCSNTAFVHHRTGRRASRLGQRAANRLRPNVAVADLRSSGFELNSTSASAFLARLSNVKWHSSCFRASFRHSYSLRIFFPHTPPSNSQTPPLVPTLSSSYRSLISPRLSPPHRPSNSHRNRLSNPPLQPPSTFLPLLLTLSRITSVSQADFLSISPSPHLADTVSPPPPLSNYPSSSSSVSTHFLPFPLHPSSTANTPSPCPFVVSPIASSRCSTSSTRILSRLRPRRTTTCRNLMGSRRESRLSCSSMPVSSLSSPFRYTNAADRPFLPYSLFFPFLLLSSPLSVHLFGSRSRRNELDATARGSETSYERTPPSLFPPLLRSFPPLILLFYSSTCSRWTAVLPDGRGVESASRTRSRIVPSACWPCWCVSLSSLPSCPPPPSSCSRSCWRIWDALGMLHIRPSLFLFRTA
jgi:hypothetical protein